MRKINYESWKLLLSDNLSDQNGKALFDAIQNNHFKIKDLLKENQRSKVQRITVFEKDLVYKIPTEKNNRKWIRFMTWFRKGEAFKNITGMDTLWSKDIKTTVPIMAAEKRLFGMVTESWLLYEYLDGQSCLDQFDYHPMVIETLKEIHKKGLLHGDSQIRNFVISHDEIYVIDSNPKPTGIFGFDRAYEWAYLRKSNPGIEKFFGDINDWWLYKLAFWYDIYERKFTEKKRAFLRLVGLR